MFKFKPGDVVVGPSTRTSGGDRIIYKVIDIIWKQQHLMGTMMSPEYIVDRYLHDNNGWQSGYTQFLYVPRPVSEIDGNFEKIERLELLLFTGKHIETEAQ